MKGPGGHLYYVILGVLVVVAAIRIVFRVRRRRGLGGMPAGGAAPDAGRPRRARLPAVHLDGDTWLVAGREIRERMRRRAFRVVTLLILAAVAAAIVIPAATRTKGAPQRVGVVGIPVDAVRSTLAAAAKSVGTGIRLVPVRNESTGKSELGSGALDLLVIDGRAVLVENAPTSTSTSATAQLAMAAAHALGDALAVASAHLSAFQVAQLSRAKPVPILGLHATPPVKNANRGTALTGIILIFVMLSQYNGWTLIGVMEEKASRVVEVLLATVRPIQLLGGKVLGIGTVVLLQSALIVAFALIVARVVGSSLLKGAAPDVVLASLLWLVLGYAFYCWVYAAAGSMAERQDQVQTLALPLSLPMVLGYIVAITAASSGSPSALVRVLAYLPPTAPFDMTVLVGIGAATWWEFLISALISLVCTAAVAWMAAGIYKRAVLRTGHRVRIRELLPERA